uniref:Fasciculation and elongation protein zeta-2 n=1 Tax=Cacopsylla melanoneura TaxID=428564 RepID=A0A8D8Q1B1_9HEMI
MKDSGKMDELKFEAPLVQFEDTEDCGIMESNVTTGARVDDQSSDAANGNVKPVNVNKLNSLYVENAGHRSNTPVADNFNETFSGSLEDLVNTFDDKITDCFCDFGKAVEELAPVQIRSQEEIMNECQMWWTLTGNFGNILPIDWSKSQARKLHVPALNLKDNKRDDDMVELTSEDEATANDLDMHNLIISSYNTDSEPLKSAEEILKEIDDIMDEGEASDVSPDVESRGSDVQFRPQKRTLQSPIYEEKISRLTEAQLNELYMEIELLTKEYSETLIAELALRDELEYEKELKNQFISLLLAVQKRRREYHVEKKRGNRGGLGKAIGVEPKYLTTVIPYHAENIPMDNDTLQILLKILKAINEDSPAVPTLLTDYILKVICPT